MHCKFNCSKMIQISSKMRTENILQTKNSFTSCIFAEFHYKFYGHFDKISRQLKLGSKFTRKNSNNSNKVFCATPTFQHGCSAKGFSHNFIIALQKGQLWKLKFPEMKLHRQRLTELDWNALSAHFDWLLLLIQCVFHTVWVLYTLSGRGYSNNCQINVFACN